VNETEAPEFTGKREDKLMDPADPHNLHDTADHPILERIEIATEGNDCDECVRKLRAPLLRIRGVKEVNADPDSERVYVTFDARKTHAPDLHDAILRSGYKPAPISD
jgi:copper chaperone CopZ